MRTDIVGVYNNVDETIQEIQRLREEGKQPEQITIVTKEDYKLVEVARKTDAHTKHMEKFGTDETQEESFWDKVVNLFKGHKDLSNDTKSRLTQLGLSGDEADKYASGIDEGKILIITESLGTVPLTSTEDPTRKPE
ncbi:hypothetical protein CR194_05770 [Salipaludibacillus keqinensis]|uniref:General stress protein 17M-like domain-containing protein n=1 Tax=Salipaludibacillus keqinensis TaxID=2045207 RepID=A0A323TKB0_9BACI|nr:general stress protein [Salipaludibacillus keqinensis]PYZ95020.1 hypothetical protein CR194_05770 [Salipaludibacillus keqinensis]